MKKSIATLKEVSEIFGVSATSLSDNAEGHVCSKQDFQKLMQLSQYPLLFKQLTNVSSAGSNLAAGGRGAAVLSQEFRFGWEGSMRPQSFKKSAERALGERDYHLLPKSRNAGRPWLTSRSETKHASSSQPDAAVVLCAGPPIAEERDLLRDQDGGIGFAWVVECGICTCPFLVAAHSPRGLRHLFGTDRLKKSLFVLF